MNRVMDGPAWYREARAALRNPTATPEQRDAARDVLGLAPLECGTRARYVNCRCRCTACREANTAYFRERRSRQRWLP